MSTSGGSSAPSGTAGGDLSGTYPNPGVAKLAGSPLGTMTGAGTGNVVTWSGTVWHPAAPAAAGSLNFASHSFHTASNISFNSTSFVEIAAQTNGPGTGGSDCSVACVTNDFILLGAVWQWAPAASSAMYGDWQVTHSSNFVSSGQIIGVAGLAALTAAVSNQISSTFIYQVVAGDISGGNAVFRPMVRGTPAGTQLLQTVNNQSCVYALNLSALISGA